MSSLNKKTSQQPRSGTSRSGMLFLLLFLVCTILISTDRLHASEATAQVEAGHGLVLLEPNRPELAWPIAGQKLVIAHYMTGMIPTPAGETRQWMDPDLYDPHGSTAGLGGIYQTLPIPMLLYSELPPPKQAALLEMRTAMALGVDGFNFYYPFGPDSAFRDKYDRFILSFFEAAKENNLDFKLTICYAPYGGIDLTTAQKIQDWGARLKWLLEQTGHSDNWLRTPDGRYLFYTWCGDGIVNEYLDGKHWEIRRHPELLQKAASAFDQIARIAGVQGAFLYHLQFPEEPQFLEAALDYFPAVTGWVSVGDDHVHWRRVAQQCAARDRTYVQEVHPDYYSSKVYPTGSYDMIFDPQRAVELGTQGIERHAQIVGLTQTFRDKLQMAIDLESPLINFTTWNDYPEGHHLAPEINHNFGFAVLLKHYLSQWRGTDEGIPDDAVIVFFKKYPARVRPDPFDIKVRNKRSLGEPEIEDAIEVVTILAEPGVLRVNAHPPREVPAGLTVTRFEMAPGPVIVEVTRGGQAVTGLTTPEWITFKPFRTDRLTYSFSSEFERLYEKIYGEDASKHTSMQYAQDGQGAAQWHLGTRTLYR